VVQSRSVRQSLSELNQRCGQSDVRRTRSTIKRLAMLLLEFKAAGTRQGELAFLKRFGCIPPRVPASPSMQPCRHAAVNIDERDVSKIRKQSQEGKVMAWVEGRIAKHDLCPWARFAAENNDIKVVVSDATDEEALLKILREEAAELNEPTDPSLATTLVACTGAWALDFARFDEFVETTDVSPTVKLVCFHPSFSRWPDWDLKVGDAVLSHHWQNYAGVDELLAQQADDGEKTDDEHLAEQADDEEEIVDEEVQDEDMDKEHLLQASKEINNDLLQRTEIPARGVVLRTEDDVGVREVEVRFEHGDEVVSVDWIVSKEGDDTGHAGGCPFLADNFIHRSPLPVVHLLRDDSLVEVLNDVGEEELIDLQWRNADLMRRAARILHRVP